MYQFTEDCLLGIEIIDQEHKQLFTLLNAAVDQQANGEWEDHVVKSVLRQLSSYVQDHFAHEEAYMEEINDPELARQKQEHEQFRKYLQTIEPKQDLSENRKMMEEVLEYLSRWLLHHILGSDCMIGKMSKVDPFAFTKEYETGIEMVDREHRRLFEIIHDTNELIQEELLHDKFDEIVRILQELQDYTKMHFKDEEAYMEEIGYEGLTAQKRAHDAFVEKLKEINLEEVDEHQQEYLEQLVNFLAEWLIQHILKVDKKIPVK